MRKPFGGEKNDFEARNIIFGFGKDNNKYDEENHLLSL
jgi:hypothetical protein